MNDTDVILLRVILKSGVEFTIRCHDYTLTRNGFNNVVGYEFAGIKQNEPVYLDWAQVAAIVRVRSNEKKVI